MDVIAAYRAVGSYRGAAAICGTTHKTVRRIIEAHEAASSGVGPAKPVRPRNYDEVADLVAEKVAKTLGRISAKRLLPAARAAGYEGSGRNFRRLVAEAKRRWRHGQARASGRRPAVWSPGDVLAIGWGEDILAGRKVHVFCAVLASRFRFVRFAADEQQATTLAMLAECFEVLGGVPKTVLADRMGCLKGGVVANVVVPSPDYVRFATHYRFRPDFCHAADPESKGIVENLVGYTKDDLLVPLELDDDPWAAGLAGLNERAVAWCGEVNTTVHSEIQAVPEQRLDTEAELLGELPSLRLEVGPKPDHQEGRQAVLHPVRVGPLLGSEPADWHHGHGAGRRTRPGAAGGRAGHRGGPRRTWPGRTGEVSIADAHYDRPRPTIPHRAARARTPVEREFLALGPLAEQFLTGAAAAGVTKLGTEIAEVLTLGAAHGTEPLLAALERAVAFGRWRADDVRSILATGGHAPRPTPAGHARC